MKTWIPTLALGLVIASTAALARNHGGMGDHHHDMGLGLLEFMAGEIGLTDSQEQSINELVSEARLASAVDRERMSQLRRQMRDLSQVAGSFDEATAEAIAGELAAIVSRMAVDGAQLRWEVRQVLTEEQREHVDNLRRHARASHFRFADQEPSQL